MSQHDLDIANQGFPATRADINNALQALGSSNSGATAPSTTYANQLWYDTANNIIKIRNEDNDAWISLFTLDQTNDNIEALTVNGTITADALTVDTSTLHVDSTNDRVGIGTASPDASLHIEGSGSSALRFGDIGPSSNSAVRLSRDDTTVISGNPLGYIEFGGNDSTSNTDAAFAYISGEASGTHGAGDNPTDLTFGTTAVGSSTPAERMRIDKSGRLLVYKTASSIASPGVECNFTADTGFLAATSTQATAYFNREDSDGSIIVFRQDNVSEGSISVSGTTVSYNGGHLARWSQLADNTKDTSIVKGTVMTNLDQMAVWHHEAQAATYYEEGDELPEGVSVGDEKTAAVAAYDEDNEQLNCMAVSSVEGDANVAGVFVNWDDDDDFNDMNVAMTGDMVIRIAQGTTVARGDLLMSAGDGTAKPQDDDIVRSKTIAKVTSTNVSHTYDDGSYLVPCVLMAC